MTEPLVFRPAKGKSLVLLLFCLVMASVFAALVAAGIGVIGWIGAAFFGIGGILFLLNLLPNASYLRLTEEGLQIRSLFRTHEFGWKDIERFGVAEMPGTKMVGIQFSDSVPSMMGRSLARHLSGFDGTLPDTYGLSAERLVSILNECNEAATRNYK